MVETNQQSKPVEKRFSKIGGKLCQLKVKVFSSEGVTVVDENPDTIDPKKYNAKGREEVRKYVMHKMKICQSIAKA